MKKKSHIELDLEEKVIFRSNLIRLIDRKGVDQATVCKNLDIPSSTLCDWTAGIRPVSHYRRIQLAEYFGLSSSDYLFTNRDDLNKKDLEALKDEIRQLRLKNYILENQLELFQN